MCPCSAGAWKVFGFQAFKIITYLAGELILARTVNAKVPDVALIKVDQVCDRLSQPFLDNRLQHTKGYPATKHVRRLTRSVQMGGCFTPHRLQGHVIREYVFSR